jgi:cytochrome c oxidase assembly factor CtaG
VTPFDVVTQATFSPVPLLLVVVLGRWYLGAVRRLTARGQPWPGVRTASFCLAELSLLFGFISGIAGYDRVFRVVAAQHVLIAIAAPIFLAVSAPITLALQAGRPGTQSTLERALSSQASRVLSHPKFTWTFYGLSLYLVYFTGLYAFALRHDAVLTLVHLGLLVAGCLFWWPAVGVDPVPYRPGQGARVFYMLLVLPLYTILGMALESQSRPLAPGMSLADMHAGAGAMWVSGEITGLIGTLVLFVLWLRADEKAAREHDGVTQASAATQLAHWRATRDAAARAYKG